MPGPLLTLRALGGSNSTSTDIVTDARYQLARPDLVNGVPSLSLVASAQACTVRTYIDGVFNTSLTVATTGSIPMLKASGAMLSAVELAALTFDVSGLQYAEVLHVTDEPAGSPSAPFTTVDQRTAWATANLSTLRPGVSTVWGPGAVEYVWNGPLATDWEGIRGPFPGSPSSPFASTAELLAAYPVAPSYSVRASVGTALENTEYVYKGPGVGLDAWWADIKTPIAFESLPALKGGSFAICPHIIGIGTFRVKRIAGLWRVEPGESVLMAAGANGGGYTLTAAGTSAVVLAGGTVPAGLIKIGETWAVDTHAEKTVHVSGQDVILARFGATAIGNNIQTGAGVGFHVGDVNVSWISETEVRRRLGAGKNNDGGVGAITSGVASINNAQTFDLAVTPGAAGNVINYQHCALRRIA